LPRAARIAAGARGSSAAGIGLVGTAPLP